MRFQQQVLCVLSFWVLDIKYVYSNEAHVHILEDPSNDLREDRCDAQVCYSSTAIDNSTFIHTQMYDDSESNHHQCQLYLAESSIPNAGLGLYTSKRVEKGSMFDHAELVLGHVDLFHNYKMSQLFTKEELEQWKHVIGSKIDGREDCPILAIQEECEANPGYMLTVCTKSCALKHAGLEVKKSLFALPDQDHLQCLIWALDDQCVENAYFMLETCPQRCVAHEYGIDMVTAGAYKDWLPHNYYWSGDGIGILHETQGGSHGIVPGIGAMTNAHLGLVNVGLRRHTVDSAGYHRQQDVGVGAFSDRHNLKFEAEADIPAGMELFLSYGEGYFLAREKALGLGPTPFTEDYQKADALLSKFWEESVAQQTNEEETAILYRKMLASVDEVRVKAALPTSYDILRKSKHTSSAVMSVPNAIRSNEWLQANGICLDTLRPGTSETPQAGRGAFAKRSITKGEIISPMPLLQMSRNRLRRFREMNEITSELTINYSYGHPNSSMVLLPYAPTVNFVNNNLNKSKVNARIQWSCNKHHQEEWEHDSVKDILKRGRGLMLDLVAIDNIDEGDEVFLDYGERWDTAWNNYVEGWEPALGSDKFDNVNELNAEKKIRTMEEQEKKPYGTNVSTMCWLDILKLVADGKNGVETFVWENYRMDVKYNSKPPTDDNTKLCTVEKRYLDKTSEGSFFYETTMEFSFPQIADNKISMKGFPRSSIEFVNREYTSDQFIENAFRHEIAIPDEIFPKKWIDLVE